MSGVPVASVIEPAFLRFTPITPVPVPVTSPVTVHVWLRAVPLLAATPLRSRARGPLTMLATKSSSVTPFTGSLNETVQDRVVAVMGVGVPGGLCSGIVSIDVTCGACGVLPFHGFTMSVIVAPSATVPSIFDGPPTAVPGRPSAAAGISSSENP